MISLISAPRSALKNNRPRIRANRAPYWLSSAAVCYAAGGVELPNVRIQLKKIDMADAKKLGVATRDKKIKRQCEALSD